VERKNDPLTDDTDAVAERNRLVEKDAVHVDQGTGIEGTVLSRNTEALAIR
jgi:hypothetical protein